MIDTIGGNKTKFTLYDTVYILKKKENRMTKHFLKVNVRYTLPFFSCLCCCPSIVKPNSYGESSSSSFLPSEVCNTKVRQTKKNTCNKNE